MLFKGQKVELITDWGDEIIEAIRVGRPLPKSDWPERGEVYTVSNTYEDEDGEQMVELAELYAPEDDHWLPGFEASSFRPVVLDPTIAILELSC